MPRPQITASVLTVALLAPLFAVPTSEARAENRTTTPRPAPPLASPMPSTNGARRRLVVGTSEFPADPHTFARTHAAPRHPAKGALAHQILKRPVRVAPNSRGRGSRATGPAIVPGAMDPNKAAKNVGAIVVSYMARHPSTPAPTATPVTLARRRVVSGNVRRAASVDITSQNVTGINHWWSYEEGTIPGVGRWMVNANSGNLLVQSDDMDVPHRGIHLAFRRTYNSFSRHDYWGTDGATEIGQYGGGWTNTFDAHLSTNGCPNTGYAWAGFYGFSVHDVDGARYDYCFNASGQLLPPPGMQGTSLVANPDGGSFYWTKKNGTQYTFYAPYYGGTSTAYSGRIYRISGRNQNNYIQFTYAWSPDASSSANLTNIYAATDNGGSQATLTFASFNGQVLLSQLTRPDGATISYSYDADGELISVSKPPPNNSGTPVTETYNGYQSFLMVAGPRWNAGADTDGGYVAFEMDETTTAQVDGIESVGVMNFTPSDGTNTLLQPSAATGAMLYRWESVLVQPTYTSFSDTDGHGTVQYVDGAGRPTVRKEYTGTQWLQTSEAWDASNDLIATVDARNNEIDYAYDPNGNTVAEAAPSTTTSVGTFRPTKLYDYDPQNNVVAYCDEKESHATGRGDWTTSGPPTAGGPDALCTTNGAGAHDVFAFAYPSYEPYGQLTTMTTPMGYRRSISYSPSGQAGTDFGLPTSVTGDGYTQLDGTFTVPSHTFWYDGSGNLRCYSKGVGTYVLSYDALSRLISVADPDDSSANAGSLCGKTSGRAGWNTQTTYTYYPDGSKQSEQSPSQRALSVATTYAYDLDSDVSSKAEYHGCTTAQSCPVGTTQKWYDGADQLVEVSQPFDSRTWSDTGVGYDGAPWLTRYIYDLSSGNTVTVDTSAPFRAYGNLYETLFGSGGQWTPRAGTEFDALDRSVGKFSWAIAQDATGALKLTQLTYDAAPATWGLLSQKTNPAGENVTYTYGPRNEILQESYGGDSGRTANETYTYDPNGRTASILSSQFGTQSYTYDDDGRVATSTEPSGGGLTDPAQVSYTYYPSGTRSAVSVTSTSLTQSNALTYSYRPDGLVQTKTINAFANGTWTESYTDGGRMTAAGGVDLRALSYDAYGQLVTDVIRGNSVSYTRDAEGSVVTETVPNNGGTSSVAYTLDVRGEIVDQLFSVGSTATTHYRSTPSAVCQSRSGNLVPWPDEGPTSPAMDARTCAVVGTGQMSAVMWDGYSYPSGNANQFKFDAAGRQSESVATTAAFNPPSTNPITGRETPGRDIYTKSTIDTTFDAEDHTIARTTTSTRTVTLVTGSGPQQSSSTTTGPGTATIGWGPNGHPASISGLGTLHWDGDTILFITDGNGNVIDFKAGLDGETTPMDSHWIGLTVYDRDAAGVVINSFNNGADYFGPLDPWDGSSMGSGDASGMMPPYAPYVRPDGFMALNIQINGIRAFDPTQQGWTTPDAYEGDVHDPASQMKYMWNRGNPVDYEDPSGYVADAANHTTDWGTASWWADQQDSSGSGGSDGAGSPPTLPPGLKDIIAEPPSKRGNAPRDAHGKPIELHHDGQDPNGKLVPMTREQHRGKGNFAKNHPNTGQRPSKIDRGAARKARHDFWKGIWDLLQGHWGPPPPRQRKK